MCLLPICMSFQKDVCLSLPAIFDWANVFDIELHVVVLVFWSLSQLFVTPWTVAHQASLCFTTSQCLLKLMSIESVRQSNHLILCHPLLLLPSVFPSIRVFSSELALCIRWPKYWSFSIDASASVLPMNIQCWFLLGLTGLISLQSKELSRPFSSTTIWEHRIVLERHQPLALSLL